MPANAFKSIPLTLFGQPVQGLSFTVGETVFWDLVLQDPATRAPIDLTGANVILSFVDLDLYGLPTQPPLISRQADISNAPTTGVATAMFASGDTVPTPATAFAPKTYGLDIYLTDASGNRLQSLTFSLVELLPAASIPGTPITPLPSQSPLAQGPAGPANGVNAANFGFSPSNSAAANTAALTAALAALTSGGLLVIPAGTYQFRGPFLLASNVLITGSGAGATILQNTATDGSHAFQWIGNDGNRLDNFNMCDLQLQGNAASGDGLHVEYSAKLGAGKISVTRCIITQHGGHGVYWSAGDSFPIIDTEVSYNGQHGVLVFNPTNIATIDHCIIHHNVKNGVYLNQVASTCSVRDSEINDNGQAGVEAQNCEQPMIEGVGFNRNSNPGANPNTLGPNHDQSAVANFGAVYLTGSTGKPTVAARVVACLLGDNDPSGYDVHCDNVCGVMFANNYVFVVNAAKPATLRISDQSQGINAIGNFFYVSNHGAYTPFSFSGGSASLYSYGNFMMYKLMGLVATNVINNGSGLCRCTVTAHGLSTNAKVMLIGVNGTVEANGTWAITVIDANTFDLVGSTFTNVFAASPNSTVWQVYANTDEYKSFAPFADTRWWGLHLLGESAIRWYQRGDGTMLFGNGTIDPTLSLGYNEPINGVPYLDCNSNVGCNRLSLLESAVTPGVISGRTILWVDSVTRRLQALHGSTGNQSTVMEVRTTVPTYSASITPGLGNGNWFRITPTDGNAFTINTPSLPASAVPITFTIRNTTGGSLGTLTWSSVFKMAAWVQPANGFNRSITFNYDGTNYVEISRSATDIPN